MPYSKFASNYNKENIQNFTIKQGFSYIYMGDLLGGKNIQNYQQRWNDEDFLKGIKRLQNGLYKKYNIALMCGEKEPVGCHRFHLIGDFLLTQNIDIGHIVLIDDKYTTRPHTSFIHKDNEKILTENPSLF